MPFKKSGEMKPRAHIVADHRDKQLRAGRRCVSVWIVSAVYEVGYYAALAGKPVTDIPKSNPASWALGYERGLKEKAKLDRQPLDDDDQM